VAPLFVQKDTTGLSTENSELKLRLQSMEQQAQLRDGMHGLHEAVSCHGLKLNDNGLVISWF